MSDDSTRTPGSLLGGEHFEPRRSLAEQIAKHLEDLIVRGVLRSRERVQEQRVARELGVSRGSVREALLILETRHLIEILPRRGAMVTDLTEHSVNALYEVIVTLYTFMAKKVAQVWQEDDLQPFLDLSAQMRCEVEAADQPAFFSSTFEFGQSAIELLKNPYLEEILRDLAPMALRTRFFADTINRNAMVEGLGFYDSLVDAALHRDLVAIERLIREYYARQQQLVIQALQAQAA